MGGRETTRQDGQTRRAAANRRVATAQPGAQLRVKTRERERTLTVERRGPPAWASGGDGTEVLTLLGADTTYALRGYPDREDRRPWLYWPSERLHGRPVVGLSVLEPGEPIVAEATAADLFWRVDRYDGR
jgi:hypothetical protein